MSNVVLFGAGRMGAIRASLLYASPAFNLVGIIDPHLPSAEKLASKFRVPVVSNTLTEAFSSLSSASSSSSSNDVSGVVVSTPTFTHFDVFREAADLGLHIFSEKPIDETAAKIKDVYAYTESKNVSLCCGFQRRFDPSYVAVKESIVADDVGEISLANVIFHDSPTPSLEFLLKGGDIFMDLAPHDVDYVLWCLKGAEVESVYATGTASRPELGDIMDAATMLLKTTCGKIVTLSMSRSSTYGYDQRTEFFGTKGCARVNNVAQNGSQIGTAKGINEARYKESFPQRFNEGFRLELEKFGEVLRGESEWPISQDDCMKVQMIADAAGKSAKEGRVVMMSEYKI
jgi:myo-inositol 2-dehydrogenase/D-chiro-inositol 1-dehydrogenase